MSHERYEVPQPPMGFEYHFFVSYTTRESEVAHMLPEIDEFVDRLKSAGLRAAPVFFDRFTLGQWQGDETSLLMALNEAVHRSVCMLSFVSPSYPTSRWCQLEWLSMAQRHVEVPFTFPVIWKDMGDDGWESAGKTLGLSRLPDRMRIIYPTNMHFFIPPAIQLRAKSWRTYYPVETFDDQLGWQRALEEAFDFICDRTELVPKLRHRQRDPW